MTSYKQKQYIYEKFLQKQKNTYKAESITEIISCSYMDNDWKIKELRHNHTWYNSVKHLLFIDNKTKEHNSNWFILNQILFDIIQRRLDPISITITNKILQFILKNPDQKYNFDSLVKDMIYTSNNYYQR